MVVTGLVRVFAAAAILVALVAGIDQPRSARRVDGSVTACLAIDDPSDDPIVVPQVLALATRSSAAAPCDPLDPSQIAPPPARVLADAPKTSPPHG